MVLKKIDELTNEDIASICDHTFLKRTESFAAIAKKGEDPIAIREKAFDDFFSEVAGLGFMGLLPYAVCVRPEDVSYSEKRLRDLGYLPVVETASVVGFPDGSLYSTDFKVAEAELAMRDGATEIDMVLNYHLLKGGHREEVKRDIKAVVNKAHLNKALVKVILETSMLNEYEIARACEIANMCGADFVKTSTGFSSSGAKVGDVKLMAEHFPRGIKISGGVNEDNVYELLRAASRRDDGYIDLDPISIRIGESSLLKQLVGKKIVEGGY